MPTSSDSQIAGRWTVLHRSDWGRRHDSLIVPDSPVPVGDDTLHVIPAVPCHDAAVNHATAVLLEHDLPDMTYEEIVVAVLRAAGETP